MNRSILRLTLFVIAWLPTTSLPTWAGEESLPAGANVTSLRVHPESITLDSPFTYSQLLVTATLDSGATLDATRMATMTSDQHLASISPTGLVRPKGDGSGMIQIRLGTITKTVPFTFTKQKETPHVSFVKDVQPTISKLGCNSGTCHGAAQGKVGFKLSLRGYDPIFDHRAFTDDIEGRRFNRAAPERSLMLMKPGGAVPHVGGVLCQPGEPYYELIKAWIADGVKLDLKTPRVKSIEVIPATTTINEIGSKQQFAVIATYTDGAKRDVSREAFIDSSNTEVATVSSSGLLTSVRRGEATMLARYEGAYAAGSVVVMGDRSGFAWKPQPVLNWIDELVDAKLKKVKILPSGLCTDEEFVRRIMIDLTGLPPSADDVRKFMADPRSSQEKRNALVDQLVGSEAFVIHWTNKWSDLLQVNRKFLGEPGAKALHDWIRNAVAKNMPYDKFAYEILTASGSNIENPPASYYKVLRTPDELMENTTQLFLAIRFNCNKCHDHPFERWTQDQYYELAAFFAQVSRTPDPKYKGKTIGGTAVEKATPLVELIVDAKTGEETHVRTGEIAKPQFPFVHATVPNSKLPRREQLGKWITSPTNPYFAKSYVNRIWSYLLGVGIIEPVDDIRAGNPPTNPALLDRLTKEFIESGFDTQAVFKTICKSRTYQLSIRTNDFNKLDELNYSHALPRRLPAEVLFDSIYRVTGSLSQLPGLPPGSRASQLLDSNVELPGAFLDIFGKPVRESACECERSNTMMLGPVLAMVNGPIVSDAIKDPKNHITRFTLATPDDKKVVEEIFLSVLNRKPTPEELTEGVQAILAAHSDAKRMRDVAKAKADALAAYQSTLDAKQKEWEAARRSEKPTVWETLAVQRANAKSDPAPVKESAGKKDTSSLAVQKDGSILAVGKPAATDTYIVVGRTPMKEPITAIRLEVFADAGLPEKGPGRAPNGNFVLNEFKLNYRLSGEKPPAKPKPIPLTGAKATFQQAQFNIERAIDNNPATGWAIAPQFGKNQTALFRFQKPVQGEKGILFTISMNQQFGGSHLIGKFRLSITTDKNPLLASPLSPELAKLLDTPVDKRTPQQTARLRVLYLAQDKEYQRLEEEVRSHPLVDARVLGAQDLTWALINSPAFFFNH